MRPRRGLFDRVRISVSNARQKNERAFVLVLLSLIMTALFLMAGFAVDLGYWYLRSAQIQRASDAAALAASIDMPDTYAATQDALASAQKNGFTNGLNGVTVTVTPQNAGKVTVQIQDPKVATFFTSLLMNHVSITRNSSAERLSPVPMSTPYNVLGSGDQEIDNFPQQHFWLAVNGYCTPKEDGDLFSSGYDGNRRFKKNGHDTSIPSPDYAYNTDCTGDSEPNTAYRPDGYDYVITVPANAPGTTSVDVYDPAFNGFCWFADWWSSFPKDAGYPSNDSCTPGLPNGRAKMDTTYTLYDMHGSESPIDDTIVAGTSPKTWGYVNNPQDGQGIGEWKTIGLLPANHSGEPHKYRLNVHTAKEPDSYGVNTFSIRAVRGWADDTYCDSRVTADCPQVAGDGAMSVNTDAVSDTGFDTFYVADIDQSYAGDNLTLSLWDPGEGFNELRLIAPDGRVVPVRWSASPPVPGTPSGAVYAVDTSDTGCPDAPWDNTVALCTQPGDHRYGTSKLNDRMVTITAQIPHDYASYIARAHGSTWWSVQYEAAPGHEWDLHDRTTWQVQIGGQEPAHLVPSG